MDFGSLLHIAQQKTQSSKNEVRYYKTKFEPPKKEERNSKSLSVNIQKFLARKEAEEKNKAEEARVKKLELLALRAQDSKAKRRVQTMLKRTKSANKSVIDDAVDKKDTAVTLAGPSQPDEDDYGYESQEAAAYYAKMMERYGNMPEEEKFPPAKRKAASTNLESTRDRVKAALLKEQEDALLPHKRKRRTKAAIERDANGKSGENSEDISSSYQSREPEKEESDREPEKKPKFKKPMPPPLDFNQLLKIAEKKQFEPIIIEPKKVDNDERPLTKKQRREYEKEKAYFEAKEARQKAQNERGSRPNEDPNRIPRLNGSNGKIPKLNSSSKNPSNGPKSKLPGLSKSSSSSAPSKPRITDPAEEKMIKANGPKLYNLLEKDQKPKVPVQSNTRAFDSKSVNDNQRLPQKKPGTVPPQSLSKKSDSNPNVRKPDGIKKIDDRDKLNGGRPSSLSNKKPLQSGNVSDRPGQSISINTDLKKNSLSMKDAKSKQLPVNGKPRPCPPSKQFPPGDVKSRQFPPGDVKPRQFPPADVKPRQFPPPDVQRRQFPPKNVKRKQLVVKKGRIIDDDDSEYDSELDDFIDDGPEEGEDYSKYISEIFGYDKSRYRDIDEGDDAAMESNFSNILKEEYISTKIGIMEDLEDMKKEQEEKKRKMMMKKQRR